MLGSLLWIWLLASHTQDCLLGLGCLYFTPGAVIGNQTSRGAGISMLGSSAAATLHFHQQILQGSKPQLLCMTSLFLDLPMLPRLHFQQWPLLASQSADPLLNLIIPSGLQNRYHQGDCYTNTFNCINEVKPWLHLEHSVWGLTLRAHFSEDFTSVMLVLP